MSVLRAAVMEATYGRAGRILAVDRAIPGFLVADLEVDPPPGGWHAGHEIELRVAAGVVRHYTVWDVCGDERFRVAIDLSPSGPGARWWEKRAVGDTITVAAARHRRRFAAERPHLYLADGSALALVLACASAGSFAVVELPEAAIGAVLDRYPQVHPLVLSAPGVALHAWLTSSMATRVAGGVEAAVVAGHAVTVQELRARLVSTGTFTRRQVTTRAYWATGRTGL